MKVLLADNSIQVCKRLEILLREVKGLRIVGKARTVCDTIAMFDRLKPDAIILEVQMHDGSGITVVRHVKREASAPIIIVLTNSAYPQFHKQYLKAGADFFFDKSFEFEHVVEVFKKFRVSAHSEKEIPKDELYPAETT